MTKPNGKQSLLAVCEEIDNVVQNAALAKIEKFNPIEQAERLAKGITSLRNMITDERMQPIMALQGSRLGFVTDKDRENGYEMKVVRECYIESLLRGLRPIGNEWNIIAGNLYITKNGLGRLVREFPGLLALEIDFGIPSVSESGATISGTANWTRDGEAQTLTTNLAIRVNKKGMGADAIVGKATRKLLARIYDRLTGSYFAPDGEVEPTDPAQFQAPDGLDARLETANGVPKPKRTRRTKAEMEAARLREAQEVLDKTEPVPTGAQNGMGLTDPKALASAVIVRQNGAESAGVDVHTLRDKISNFGTVFVDHWLEWKARNHVDLRPPVPSAGNQQETTKKPPNDDGLPVPSPEDIGLIGEELNRATARLAAGAEMVGVDRFTLRAELEQHGTSCVEIWLADKARETEPDPGEDQ